jgi:hypothetical protein
MGDTTTTMALRRPDVPMPVQPPKSGPKGNEWYGECHIIAGAGVWDTETLLLQAYAVMPKLQHQFSGGWTFRTAISPDATEAEPYYAKSQEGYMQAQDDGMRILLEVGDFLLVSGSPHFHMLLWLNVTIGKLSEPEVDANLG